MLGKLLKHEMLYNIKKFVPMYIAFFAVAAVLRIMAAFGINMDDFGESGTGLVTGMTFIVLMIIFMFSIFGLMLYAMFGNISRFHKNLFTDEGYLMHTLPVPSYSHILCKLISGLVWYALTSVAVFGGMAVAFADMEDIAMFPYEMLSGMISDNLPETLLAFALTVVCYCAFLLLCYMSEGLVSMMGNKKFIASLIVIGCIILNSILVSVISVIAVNGTADVSETSSTMMLLNVVKLVYYVIVSAVLFLITNSLLSKHLNLE